MPRGPSVLESPTTMYEPLESHCQKWWNILPTCPGPDPVSPGRHNLFWRIRGSLQEGLASFTVSRGHGIKHTPLDSTDKPATPLSRDGNSAPSLFLMLSQSLPDDLGTHSAVGPAIFGVAFHCQSISDQPWHPNHTHILQHE